MIKAAKIVNDVQNLFFPPTCLGCGELITPGEQFICISCRHQLPLTDSINENDNPTEKILYGRVKIENAASFVRYYKKGTVQQLIHLLKYKNHQEIGAFFGQWMGNKIKYSQRFNAIDLVVPVPMHPKKLRKRGYNQVAEFGKALAGEIKATYTEDVLVNTIFTKTQTQKNRAERSEEIKKNRFELKAPEIVKNKHVLLVDDVITTGATLESCANAFPPDASVKISMATIAITT